MDSNSGFPRARISLYFQFRRSVEKLEIAYRCAIPRLSETQAWVHSPNTTLRGLTRPLGAIPSDASNHLKSQGPAKLDITFLRLDRALAVPILIFNLFELKMITYSVAAFLLAYLRAVQAQATICLATYGGVATRYVSRATEPKQPFLQPPSS